jgi:signal transduction histidine kinase
MEDQVTLDVRDDGAGFDPFSAPPLNGPGGFGLRGMFSGTGEFEVVGEAVLSPSVAIRLLGQVRSPTRTALPRQAPSARL